MREALSLDGATARTFGCEWDLAVRFAMETSVTSANQTPFSALCSTPGTSRLNEALPKRAIPEEQNMKTEHLSTDRKPKNKEQKIDDQLRDSFPTSDPPSFNPGTVGAPKEGKLESQDKTKAPRR
jgi:hypothetical protein